MDETGIVYPDCRSLTFFALKNANPVSFGLGAAVTALVTLLVAGCGQAKSTDASAGRKTVYDHFTVDVGGHPVSLQISVTEAEQERGLMQRADLGRDEGMVFVDPAPKREEFWMKNTPEPLDVAYLTPDGVIAEIYPLYPFDLRSVPSRGDHMQFAVEMPQGWFATNGVRPGARIDLKALTAALAARGFDPAAFRLK
jgi:uncharacterized membrane protein (UPF0127 family)